MTRWLPTLMSVFAVLGAIYLAAQPSAVANPQPMRLMWDYDWTPEDEGHVVAFNVWESTDCRLPIEEWALIGTTTNRCFVVYPAPVDFFWVSSFYQL